MKMVTRSRVSQPGGRRKIIPQPLLSELPFHESTTRMFSSIRFLDGRLSDKNKPLTACFPRLGRAHAREISSFRIATAVKLTEAGKITDIAAKRKAFEEIEAWVNENLKRIEEGQEHRTRRALSEQFHSSSRPISVDLTLLPKGTRLDWVMKATRNLAVLRIFGPLDSEFVDGYSLLANKLVIDHPNKVTENIANKQATLFVVINEAGWVIAAALKNGERVDIAVNENYKESHISAFLKAAIKTEDKLLALASARC